MELDIRSSALKHGVSGDSIAHAVTYPLLVDDEFVVGELPKVLVLGPDVAGNVLELIGSFDAEGVFTVFQAMPARTGYVRMLKRKEQ